MITLEINVLSGASIVEKIKDVELLVLPRPGEHILLMGDKGDRTAEVHKILHVPNDKHTSASIIVLVYIIRKFEKEVNNEETY